MASNFSVQLVVVFISCVLFRVTHSQICKEGDPVMNDPSENVPDLNITVSPASLVRRVGDVLNITCIADKPRYEIEEVRPAFLFTIRAFFDGFNEVASCDVRSREERTRCIGTVTLDKTGNITALCFARSDHGCRTKVVTVKVLEKFIQTTSSSRRTTTAPSLESTASPGSNPCKWKFWGCRKLGMRLSSRTPHRVTISKISILQWTIELEGNRNGNTRRYNPDQTDEKNDADRNFNVIFDDDADNKYDDNDDDDDDDDDDDYNNDNYEGAEIID